MTPKRYANHPSLKYPITHIEDYSPREKQKLLDVVLYYHPEREKKKMKLTFWNLLPFILLFALAIYTLVVVSAYP